MKKVSVLAIKILAFALTLVYVLAFLAMGFWTIPVLADALKTKWNLTGWGVPFIYVFWGITVVGIAVMLAVRGFDFVGKWERQGKKEELDLNPPKKEDKVG
jgi:hypothetical protein